MTAPGCPHDPHKIVADPGDWGVVYADCRDCGVRLWSTWNDWGDPDGAAGRWTRWRPAPRTVVYRG